MAAHNRRMLRPTRAGIDSVGIVALIAVLLVHHAIADAEVRGSHPVGARGRRSHRAEASAAVPLQQLSDHDRALVAPMLEAGSIHRRLSAEVLRCDPRLYQFLVDKPEVTVAIWRALGISHVRLKQLDRDRYEMRDGRGLSGQLRFLYRSPNLNLIWFKGAYQGKLSARPIATTALIQLRSAYIRETDAQFYVVHRLDTFLKLDSDAAELLMRLMEPLTASQADKNFSQIGQFLAAMSNLSAKHPKWALSLVDRLKGVSAEKREALREVLRDLSRSRPEQGPVISAASTAQAAAPAR